MSILDRGDARDTFAAFARAAAARQTTIVPLVEMGKIAAGLRAILDAGTPRGAGDPVASGLKVARLPRSTASLSPIGSQPNFTAR